MDRQTMFLWGKAHHYTTLVLINEPGRREVLRAGEEKWQQFVTEASDEQIGLAEKCIEAWEACEKGLVHA